REGRLESVVREDAVEQLRRGRQRALLHRRAAEQLRWRQPEPDPGGTAAQARKTSSLARRVLRASAICWREVLFITRKRKQNTVKDRAVVGAFAATAAGREAG